MAKNAGCPILAGAKELTPNGTEKLQTALSEEQTAFMVANALDWSSEIRNLEKKCCVIRSPKLGALRTAGCKCRSKAPKRATANG